MLKQAFAAFRLPHISLMFVGLMWVLPFLYYRHALPLTTFYQEWGAAMLGLCAMPLLLTQRYWRQPEMPRIVLLPIGLMLLVLGQFFLGKIGYFSQALLFTLYLLWAALLVMLGHRLREEFGLPVLATTLAVFLLLGAELSALVGVIQHFRWHTFLDSVVAVKNSSAVFGNLGQPNHFANYISLGLVSLGLLHSRWQLRAWQAALLAAPILFVLALSGSRSAWLYLLCFAGMAFLWQRNDKSARALLHFSLALVLGFGLMNFVVQLPWLSGDHGSVTTVARMVEAVAEPHVASEATATGASAVAETSGAGSGMMQHSIRLHIWHEAWLIFTRFPLLGAGFGQFAWQHFLLGPSLRNADIVGIYSSAHNIVMQTAAEMGVTGLLIWFGTLVLWIRQMYRAPRTVYHWWGSSVLAVLAIHSLVEYPLWYAYFIGVAAVTLGMLDSTTFRLELRNVGRLSMASILLLGVLSLGQMWQGYRSLEYLAAPKLASENNDYFNELMKAHKQALLQHYVEEVISGLMEGRVDNLSDMRELNESVMHFMPTSSVSYREVILLALSGEQAEAQLQLERAIWAFPGSYFGFMERLRTFARKDPAHFAALLEFAPKKFEERQLAVHTK